jgi:hypothetical protein
MRHHTKTARRRQSDRHLHRRTPLMSSHPEIEEEIIAVGGGIDESRLGITEKPPAAKPIVSIDGRDVEREGQNKNDRAA